MRFIGLVLEDLDVRANRDLNGVHVRPLHTGKGSMRQFPRAAAQRSCKSARLPAQSPHLAQLQIDIRPHRKDDVLRGVPAKRAESGPDKVGCGGERAACARCKPAADGSAASIAHVRDAGARMRHQGSAQRLVLLCRCVSALAACLLGVLDKLLDFGEVKASGHCACLGRKTGVGRALAHVRASRPCNFC